jgi:hypothetical protein
MCTILLQTRNLTNDDQWRVMETNIFENFLCILHRLRTKIRHPTDVVKAKLSACVFD